MISGINDISKPLICRPFDNKNYVGLSKGDIISLNIAVQDGHELVMDDDGHVFDENLGIFIAECVPRYSEK